MGSREGKAKEIINAAIRVFSKHGFDGAKMEYIAKEAGVGKGTIYEYFVSKEQLFEEMLKYSIEKYSQELKERIEQVETIERKIVKCSMLNVEVINSHRDIVQVAFEVNLLSKEMRAYCMAALNVIQEHYKEMVRAAIEKGEFRADIDEELATCCIIGTIEQFCKRRALNTARPIKEADHYAVVNILLNGLR